MTKGFMNHKQCKHEICFKANCNLLYSLLQIETKPIAVSNWNLVWVGSFFVSVLCNILVTLCSTVKSQGCCLLRQLLLSFTNTEFLSNSEVFIFFEKMYSMYYDWFQLWLSRQEYILIILKDLVIINFLLISFF